VAELAFIGDLKEMAGSPSPWSPSELSVWAPPEDILVSEWAERYRVLPKQSAIPGPWSNRLVPYAVGVMDAFIDPAVERITIMASVQSAKTESAYNMLGYAISQDPAPALVVMPTDKTLKRVNRRLQDMITESPELAKEMTGDPDDMQKRLIMLRRMEIHFATAGSKSDLANVEARYVLLDEPDRYPSDTGDEGSPMEMAEARATTFWNRKIIQPCTPTVPDAYVNIEYERSDKRRFWVPCPHCGGFQVLKFKQLKHQGEALGKWPKDKRDPDYVKRERVARYECVHCWEEIDDRDKPGMLARGKWVPDGHPIAQDGTMPPIPPTSHVGFQWSALYSPFRNFSEVAAQFWATRDDREKFKTFVNLWLAEPWKEVIKQRPASAILQLRTERPALTVPPGTLALTAGIDSQKLGFWVVIRAWTPAPGGGLHSHLVRYGFVGSFGELERWLFADVYPVEHGSLSYPVWRGGIDIGGGAGEAGESTMTEQIYEWLRRTGRGRIFGVKGAARALAGGKKMSYSLIDKYPNGKPIPGGIQLWHLDTGRFKDDIWSRVETGRFHLHAETKELYARQLASEAKERDRRGREVWVIQSGKDNHLLDCEVYAAAMADPECWGGVSVLARFGEEPPQEAAPAAEGVNPITGRPFGSFWG
jgi:phage terminase large subunit GpA-like protein